MSTVFDIASIREQLNELAFEDGKRAVPLGVIAELFPRRAPAELERELRQLEAQLGQHDLQLQRGGADAQELFAVQTLKVRDVDLTWMANGIQWVAKITTVAMEMVVPAILGMWLDQTLGTAFLGILGIILGLPLGLWHLVRMTSHVPNDDR